ncbi:unnamed protein product [Ostreobium quekettii]|uniref:CAAX prenyl protease n=1 Tax=Ostreobium quekettii TaxID=121088 RepID=A0A8S1IRV0_9CHLO|nr:unnamed protein product [Ostreobium quekettii]|eukprot:evm.model.scf_60.10 EVM.evm.TU.scf_60.10   scf_60:93830-99076(-)
MESVPYLEFVVGFTILVYVFHTFLDVRQYKALKLPTPPESVAHLFKGDLYEKTQIYSLDKWWFSMAHDAWELVTGILTLACGFLPWLWHAVSAAFSKVDWAKDGEIVHTIAFVLILSAVSIAMDLPWGLYRTFVLEERHGFNKQTPLIYFTDLLKQMLLGLLLIPPIVGVVTYILINAGRWLPLYLWGFFFVLVLCLMTIYPVLIAPLFNKFEILEEGSLKVQIEELASSLKFPLKKVYQMDGCKRSAHSNAYMYGFFNNKRIVLYDTLIQQCTNEEVVSVLAHELGHWKMRHTMMSFAMGQALVLLQVLLFTFVRDSQPLFRSFGFLHAQPAFVSFILFQFISAPIEEVLHFVQNVVSRMFEFQADAFAVGHGHGEQLQAALVKLEEKNKSPLNVDRWFSSYHYSHPPLPERLEAIRTSVKKRT